MDGPEASAQTHRPSQLRYGIVKTLMRNPFRPVGDEPLDPLGIPWRAHYLIVAVAAFNMGAVPLALSFTPGGHELTHPVIRTLCMVGMVLGPLYMVIARQWRYEYKEWFFFTVMLLGTAGMVAALAFVENMVGPFLATFLLSPTGAAIYLRPKLAIPQIVLMTGVILFLASRVNEPFPGLRTINTAIVCATGALMVIALKRHLEATVTRNRCLSESDPLTGAANLRRFETRFVQETDRVERGGAPFALITLDLDDFKQSNDRYNHTMGDDVLTASAAAIHNELSVADLLVRRGGDEFVVLAPAVVGRDLGATIDRIKAGVAAARHRLCPDIIPSASAAWIQYEPGDDLHTALQKADAALHAIKIDAPSTRRGTVSANEVADVVTNVAKLHPIGSSNEVDATTDPPTEIQNRHDENPIVGTARIAWNTAAIATVLIVTVIWTTAATTRHEMAPSLYLTSFATLFGVAPFCIWMARRDRPSTISQHILAVTTIGLITAECLAAGNQALSGIEFLLLPILILPALLRPRPSLTYSAIALVIFGAFLIGYDYPQIAIRWANTSATIMLLSGIVSYLRSSTIRAAETNSMLARTDALTGLPNLRRMRDRLEDEIKRCTATGERLSLVMLDLDDFKSVNDRHSHTLGDQVLTAVARAIDQTARQAEMPARRGGDEFALILTNSGKPEAAIAAKRVGRAIELARTASCPDVTPTASVGYVEWHHGETVDDLLARADQALHVQKELHHAVRFDPANAVVG